MSLERWGWTALSLTCVVVSGLAAALFVHLTGLDAGENQAIAAWVQAVGSVLAIAGALTVAGYQVNAARTEAEIRRRVDEREALESIAAFVNELETVGRKAVERARNLAGDGKVSSFRVEVWERTIGRMIERMNAVPFHESPYARVARPAIVMTTASEEFVEALLELKKQLEPEARQAVIRKLEGLSRSMQTGARLVREKAGVQQPVVTSVEKDDVGRDVTQGANRSVAS